MNVDLRLVESQGKRPSMEDFNCIEQLGPEELLVGIFDGHNGAQVAEMGAKHLRRLFEGAEGDPLEKLEASFNQLQANVKLLELAGGACALAFHLRGSELSVASLGDLALCWVPREEPAQCLVLTVPHRLDNPEELVRVYQAGAVLRKPYWVHPQNGHGLQPTRSLGDLREDGPWLSHDPLLLSCTLDGEGFVVAACDGLFDVVGREEIARSVLESEDIDTGARLLGEMALGRGQDNLTLIVIHLSASQEPSQAVAPEHGLKVLGGGLELPG
jgi:serine/threonine protein phosphatase PrpC